MPSYPNLVEGMRSERIQWEFESLRGHLSFAVVAKPGWELDVYALVDQSVESCLLKGQQCEFDSHREHNNEGGRTPLRVRLPPAASGCSAVVV